MFCWNHMCAILSTLMLAVPSAWAEDDSYAPRSREQVSSMLRRSMGPGPSSGSVLSIYRRIARRYREIFRPPADYDGDGYADLAAAAVDGFATIDEEVNVYYGGPSGLAVVPDLVIPDPLPDDFEAFSDATFAGDVNGYGYGDLVVGANSAPGGGAVYVYFGRRSGLPATPDQVLRAVDTGVQDTRAFGFRVERARDLDRDGYDDIIVSAIATSIEDVQDGVVFVYRGGSMVWIRPPAIRSSGAGAFSTTSGTRCAQPSSIAIDTQTSSSPSSGTFCSAVDPPAGCISTMGDPDPSALPQTSFWRVRMVRSSASVSPCPRSET